MMSVSSTVIQRAQIALDQLRRELLATRRDGHWVGELAASALSTATAVSALAKVAISDPGESSRMERALVDRGMTYLRAQQNDDGGFGDTDRSYSNIATSYLVLAATHLAVNAGCHGLSEDQRQRLEVYISHQGNLDGLRRRYGTDKTFVVPIMTNLAIAGLVSWDDVPRLPFEAAAVPQSFYRLVRMPVVSYAIPALVAIGQARHFHGSPTWWPLRKFRSTAVPRTTRVLREMQPESGGYLEATPLTSFVVMSLAATDRGDHPVSQLGVEFLRNSIAQDGSWPIDTNLATWLTSLSILALNSDASGDREWINPRLVKWLLECQHRVRHPYTGAEPGGWGWTDLSGAVPDGDDTPAAMLALLGVRDDCDPTLQQNIDAAVLAGARWLLGLQNRDGGWPTFCRGWGKLPFDRSSTDLTAHSIRALRRTGSSLSLNHDLTYDIDRAIRRGEQYLVRCQQPRGGWLPLWFGNQDEPDDINPVYGTARVLLSIPENDPGTNRQRYGDQGRVALVMAFHRACCSLLEQQNADGGWGGGPSVNRWWSSKLGPQSLVSTMEETAIAIEGLLSVWAAYQRDTIFASGLDQQITSTRRERLENAELSPSELLEAAIIGGVEFLIQGVETGRHREPWPIGFYFAKLWYHERLYPVVFAVSALGKFLCSVKDRYDGVLPQRTND